MEEEQDYNVTPDQVLQLAMGAHRLGVINKAKEFYEALLQAQPDHPDALHYYGVLQHQIGSSDEGLAKINRAIELGNDSAELRNNKGNVLRELKRFEEAEGEYLAALERQPEHVEALCNLGITLRSRDDIDGAETYLRKATQLDPKHGESWHNLGNLLKEKQQTDKAIECYRNAVEFGAYQHSSGRSARNLAVILAATGKPDEAEQVLRSWLAKDADNPIAKHLLAALTQKDVPERADDAFVVNSFRDYAAHFDESLARLSYRAPELVGAQVKALLPSPTGSLSVCDLGCGTGLAAQFIAPYAAKLVGVDLSPQMLGKARERHLYQELIEAEITQYMSGQKDAFDLVTCVDTLCYLGALEDLFTETSAALKAGGSYVFTVEAMAESDASDGHEIGPSGRYRHQRSYLQQLMAQSGFTNIAIETVVLRTEGGKPVEGYLCSASSTR